MKILALEFSSAQRSVAVFDAGGPAVGSEIAEVIETGGQSTKPFSMIEAALQQARWDREQIECVAVGLGPGSYAGIRTALAVAQGWQLAAQVKLAGISSVECVAEQARGQGINGRVLVIVDAQRGEFYAARYEITPSELRQLEALRLVSEAEVRAWAQGTETLVGPDLADSLPGGRLIFPRAAMVARLASRRTEFLTGDRLEPIYLRATSFVKAPSPQKPAG